MSAQPLTLYTIEDELVTALDTIEMLDPETDQGLRAELEEQIARLVASEITKVDGVCRMLAHFESQAELAGEEIRRLQARKKSFERSAERLESCARLAMECAGVTKLEGATSTLKLQKNPPAVLITGFDIVPAQYRLVKLEESIDKDAVKRDLKAGVDVAGAQLTYSTRLVRQ